MIVGIDNYEVCDWMNELLFMSHGVTILIALLNRSLQIKWWSSFNLSFHIYIYTDSTSSEYQRPFSPKALILNGSHLLPAATRACDLLCTWLIITLFQQWKQCPICAIIIHFAHRLKPSAIQESCKASALRSHNVPYSEQWKSRRSSRDKMAEHNMTTELRRTNEQGNNWIILWCLLRFPTVFAFFQVNCRDFWVLRSCSWISRNVSNSRCNRVEVIAKLPIDIMTMVAGQIKVI